jgi:hypothetical protein
VLRFTVSAHPDANPSLHSISIGPASAAPAASFKRLYRTRAEHRVQLRALEKRASDKALTFVGTNSTGELKTGLPVICQKTDDTYIRFTIGECRKSKVVSQCRTPRCTAPYCRSGEE